MESWILGLEVDLGATIIAIESYLPKTIVTNKNLGELHPNWNLDRLSKVTGIYTRHIASEDEHTSDLAIAAARKLFLNNKINESEIDFVILCTQTPDFYLPTTACLVQNSLGLSTSLGALDITLGCSGYVYALGLAKGYVDSGQANNVLVLTSETFTKLMNPEDKSTVPLFGDGATATLVSNTQEDNQISGITWGSDGTGGKSLLVPNGGLRSGTTYSPNSQTSVRELVSNGFDLYMDGPEVFNFTIREVPPLVQECLIRSNLTLADIDYFVFHQANEYMLETLRKKLEIPKDKFLLQLNQTGNTGSSSIPIALAIEEQNNRFRKGDKILIAGFGVGLSWAAAVITW